MPLTKATPELVAMMIRLWNENKTQDQIALAVGLSNSTVRIHLRAALGVKTPEHWDGGRAVLPKPEETPEDRSVFLPPENPARLATQCELTPGEAARFWSKVAEPNANGCRLWLAICGPGGYGQFPTIVRPSERAPRVSWRLTYGPLGEDEQALHRCDNPSCVEPTHLFKGTQLDNMRDMYSKYRDGGQGAIGERNINAKLTWEDVRAMRKEREEKGTILVELGKKYGITHSVVSQIVRYKSWKES